MLPPLTCPRPLHPRPSRGPGQVQWSPPPRPHLACAKWQQEGRTGPCTAAPRRERPASSCPHQGAANRRGPAGPGSLPHGTLSQLTSCLSGEQTVRGLDADGMLMGTLKRDGCFPFLAGYRNRRPAARRGLTRQKPGTWGPAQASPGGARSRGCSGSVGSRKGPGRRGSTARQHQGAGRQTRS